MKSYDFTWDAVAGATSYRLYEDPDGAGPATPALVADNLTATSYTRVLPVLLYQRLNAQYTVQACNADSCSTDSAAVQPDVQRAIGYFKASVASVNFGISLALSGDGTTLAVGAFNEASAAGAVYVFRRSNGAWAQQARLQASNTRGGIGFGRGVTLSEDGNTLAVGAPFESSDADGVNGDQADTSQQNAGAAYVFARSSLSGLWSQEAYVKAPASSSGDVFGYELALSGDGNTLAVGARDAGQRQGRVAIYARPNGVWTFQSTLVASNAGSGDGFGRSVSLSRDGNVLVSGATGEDSSSGALPLDNSRSSSGAAYVFRRSGTAWTQEAYLKASLPKADTFFGVSVAISADGSTVAVGAPVDGSSATGIDGDEASTAASSSGAVYVFVKGTNWAQQAYVKAGNTGVDDRFGDSVRLSGDGNVLVVGAPDEDGAGKGLASDASSNAANGAGAVYVLRRIGTTWAQEAHLKASNTRASDSFGFALALSADGTTLASGSPLEDSNATGIGGNQANTSASGSGAVYLY